MENFAGTIGALDEYSIFSFEQSCHFHSRRSARGKMLQVSFFDK